MFKKKYPLNAEIGRILSEMIFEEHEEINEIENRKYLIHRVKDELKKNEESLAKKEVGFGENVYCGKIINEKRYYTKQNSIKRKVMRYQERDSLCYTINKRRFKMESYVMKRTKYVCMWDRNVHIITTS